MLTRLPLTIGETRVAVGYDADLATYYVEAAPAGVPADPDDPDEGLVTIRGRVPRDLPNLATLTATLGARGIMLTEDQMCLLAAAMSGSSARAPRRRSSTLRTPNVERLAPRLLSRPGLGGRPPGGSGAGRR